MPDVQLPRRTKDGQEVLLEKLKSLVVVGANGSGKSRFVRGSNGRPAIKRIVYQRSVVFQFRQLFNRWRI